MKKLKIGVVGLGRVSSKTHIPVLKSFHNVEVTAGADNNPDRAERVKSIFGLNRVYNSYEEMYAKEELDGVYICLPNFLHKDACKKALEHGLHVFCEKPMCMSVEESMEITTLADEKGLVLMPGYKKRYAENFAEAKKIIEEGILGNIVHIQGTFVTPGPYISWDPKSDWYLDEKWHGVIYDVGCHIIELLLYIAPFEVFNVNSAARNGFTGYNTPTNVACSFEMKGGIIGDLTIGWRAATDIISLSIHGTAGSISVSRDDLVYVNPGTDPVDKIMFNLKGFYRESSSLIKKIGDKVRGMNFYREDLIQAESFCKAILGEVPPPVDGRAAVNVHKFLEQIIASLKK